MSQEHWLTEKQLPRLKELGVQFSARSGMEPAVSTGVLRGRPFGGVCIAWSPDLDHVITPLSNYKHNRVVAVKLKAAKQDIVFICAYMPFFDSSNRMKCKSETIDALSMIDSIVHDHPDHLFVIGGDMNTELNGTSSFDAMWDEFARKNSLAYCSHFFSVPGYTYHHESLGQTKLNDHFIVSKSILDNQLCSNYQTLENGDNPSDHLPIMMSLLTEFQINSIKQTSSVPQPQLRWDKIPTASLDDYFHCLWSLMSDLSHNELVCDADCHCESDLCKASIQDEYDRIIGCLRKADSLLPRHTKGRDKDWWNADLSVLKNQSIEIQRLWLAEGRPSHGPTSIERRRVRAAYRLAIRAAQKAPNQESWNKLHTAMQGKDTNNFWHSWKSLYNKNDNSFAPVVNGCSSREAIADTFRQSFQNNSRPNNEEKVRELNAKFEGKYSEYSEKHKSSCNCSDYTVSVETVVEAICQLKRGKCADGDGFTTEHFHHAPLILLQRLTQLFNRMLKHGFVPSQFKTGVMIPIIKDSRGDRGDPSNYRGITISPLI